MKSREIIKQLKLKYSRFNKFAKLDDEYDDRLVNLWKSFWKGIIPIITEFIATGNFEEFSVKSRPFVEMQRTLEILERGGSQIKKHRRRIHDEKMLDRGTKNEK